MKIKALKKLLHLAIENGYGNWIVYLCDDDDDDYTVNHIFVDNDGDICLKSTDAEENTYDFTAEDILQRLKKYNNDDYVYFIEEYWDGSWCSYDIEFEWYIGTDSYGDSILNIDCSEIDDDYDYNYNNQNEHHVCNNPFLSKTNYHHQSHHKKH